MAMIAYDNAGPVKWTTIRIVAFGGVAAGYAPVGGAFESPVYQLTIKNLTDATLMFSFDGANDHMVLPAQGFQLVDIRANQTLVKQGTIVYVRRVGIPTAGSVYVEALLTDY